MGDLLRLDYINSLPRPLMARFYGGSEWPLHDIDVETGLMRIDVCGKLDVKHIGDVRWFTDADGGHHDAGSFYLEDETPAPPNAPVPAQTTEASAPQPAGSAASGAAGQPGDS